jgi:hypothetical protein
MKIKRMKETENAKKDQENDSEKTKEREDANIKKKLRKLSEQRTA